MAVETRIGQCFSYILDQDGVNRLTSLGEARQPTTTSNMAVIGLTEFIGKLFPLPQVLGVELIGFEDSGDYEAFIFVSGGIYNDRRNQSVLKATGTFREALRHAGISAHEYLLGADDLVNLVNADPAYFDYRGVNHRILAVFRRD